jgi:hypothetical protein
MKIVLNSILTHLHIFTEPTDVFTRRGRKRYKGRKKESAWENQMLRPSMA